MRKIGIVGAGYIASWHADVIKRLPDVELTAVCDTNRAAAEAFSDQRHVPCFTSLEEMLSQANCDALHILTPPQHHFANAKLALSAGKDVFLEKPMCLSSAECLELHRDAQGSQLKLGCNHNFLFQPAVEELKELLDKQRLGRIDHLRVDWMFPLPQIASGPFDSWLFAEPTNVMLELGPHVVSMAEYLSGSLSNPRAIADRSVRLPNGRVAYRRWRIIAVADDSTAVDICLSLSHGYPKRSIEVRGLAGTAHVNLERNTKVVEEYNPHGIILEPLVASRSTEKQVKRSGLKNFLLQAKSLNRLAPFGLSLERSIRAFHNSTDLPCDERHSSTFSTQVVATIEAIIASTEYSNSTPEQATTGVQAEPRSPRSRAGSPDVLVLGGTGFIGTHIVDHLVRAGHSVRILSRRGAIPPDRPGVEIVSGSYSDHVTLEKSLAGVNTVIHLARSVSNDISEYVRTDVNPTKLLGERCIAQRVERLIFAGTIDSLNVRDTRRTITEQDGLDVRIRRRNPYAQSKAMIEATLRCLEPKGLRLIIARPGIVIGTPSPPQHWGVGMWMSSTLCLFWGNGNNPLPLVLVQDVADAFVRMIETPQAVGQEFNLTGDPLVTAHDYVSAMNEVDGMTVRGIPRSAFRYFASDVCKYAVKRLVGRKSSRPSYADWLSRSQLSIIDNAKAKSTLGWQPESDRQELLELGVREPTRQFLL